MGVKLNRVMQHYLGGIIDIELPDALMSDPRVAALFDSAPLKTDDGTLVLPWTPNWKALRQRSTTDLTGYECLVNHVHLDNIIRDMPNAPRLRLKLALALGKNLGARLCATGPVTVIVSFDGEDAIVCVHRTRPGEAWLADNLERYTEGIFVIEESPMSSLT